MLVNKTHQLECFPVLHAYVCCLRKTFKVKLEVHEFFVLLVVVVVHDRDAVLKLERERVHGVVHEHNVGEALRVEDAQIFHVHVWVARPHAAGSVITSLYEGAVRVDVV